MLPVDASHPRCDKIKEIVKPSWNQITFFEISGFGRSLNKFFFQRSVVEWKINKD